MTWIVLALVASAVCGWTVAAGLYLQLKDALKLAETWREIANAAWGDVVRERHVAEFAVRAMEPRMFTEGGTERLGQEQVRATGSRADAASPSVGQLGLRVVGDASEFREDRHA